MYINAHTAVYIVLQCHFTCIYLCIFQHILYCTLWSYFIVLKKCDDWALFKTHCSCSAIYYPILQLFLETSWGFFARLSDQSIQHFTLFHLSVSLSSAVMSFPSESFLKDPVGTYNAVVYKLHIYIVIEHCTVADEISVVRRKISSATTVQLMYLEKKKTYYSWDKAQLFKQIHVMARTVGESESGMETSTLVIIQIFRAGHKLFFLGNK